MEMGVEEEVSQHHHARMDLRDDASTCQLRTMAVAALVHHERAPLPSSRWFALARVPF